MHCTFTVFTVHNNNKWHQKRKMYQSNKKNCRKWRQQAVNDWRTPEPNTLTTWAIKLSARVRIPNSHILYQMIDGHTHLGIIHHFHNQRWLMISHVSIKRPDKMYNILHSWATRGVASMKRNECVETVDCYSLVYKNHYGICIMTEIFFSLYAQRSTMLG